MPLQCYHATRSPKGYDPTAYQQENPGIQTTRTTMNFPKCGTGIKISDMEQMTGNLSGGNQQKVVIAKWLQHNCEIIIFDEPTRGIDVGAKYEIYMLMNQLAAAGKAIIMISSELPEVLGMSDRIIVMRNGEISGEVTDVSNTTQEELLDLAIH